MHAVYPAKYSDKFGEETTTIENDGEFLHVVIRNVLFEGTDFNLLDPVPEADKQNLSRFTFASGSLCDCTLEFEMPIPVVMDEVTVGGKLHVYVRLGKPRTDGGIDEELLKLTLLWDEYHLESSGKRGWFANELQHLQSSMPQNCFIKCCFNCAFSGYSPLGGFDLFGNLCCFRDNKVEFLKVQTKADFFRIAHTMTELVQETYLCPEFQFKGRAS